MWCAYTFAVLAIAGLPTALKPGNIGLLFWTSSDFLQLTLLSVIIVGQNIQARAADKRAEQTYQDAEAVLHEAIQIQAHLAAQDEVLTAQIADRLDTRTQGGITDILNAVYALKTEIAVAPGHPPADLDAIRAHIDEALTAAQEKLASTVLLAMPPATPKGDKTL